MSFGLSIGDFLALSKLLKRTVSSLRAASGADASYTSLIESEIGHLDATLQDILIHETLLENGGVRLAAADCKAVVDEFLGRLRKYEVLGKENVDEGGEGNGRISKRRKISRVRRKLQWGFGMEEEVRRFRERLAPRQACLQLRLVTAGLCV